MNFMQSDCDDAVIFEIFIYLAKDNTNMAESKALKPETDALNISFTARPCHCILSNNRRGMQMLTECI